MLCLWTYWTIMLVVLGIDIRFSRSLSNISKISIAFILIMIWGIYFNGYFFWAILITFLILKSCWLRWIIWLLSLKSIILDIIISSIIIKIWLSSLWSNAIMITWFDLYCFYCWLYHVLGITILRWLLNV